MYVVFACVTFIFLFSMWMSVRYVYANVEQQQRHDLIIRSQYIQSYLRSLYYWDVTLTPAQSQGLAIDLKDLSIDMYETGRVPQNLQMNEPVYREQNIILCNEQIDGHPFLVAYMPFHNGAFVSIGYIAVPYFLSEQIRRNEVRVLLERLIPTYLIALLLSLIFSYFATRRMTSPISMLNEKMRHFEIGAKDSHIDYPYRDVERYNLLVDRVEESAEKLANAEREGAWRTMARQIAHEINNPLTPMKLSVQKLQRLRGTEAFDAYFEKATPMLISEIDNLAHIAQSFSTFAKQPEVVTAEVDVAAKLSNVITLQRANDEQIPIRYVGADSGVTVLADQEQISQVFVNIIRNAIQAISSQPSDLKREPDIIVILNAMYSEREVQISISDNGPGIPEELREKIFRPNFTTKSNGNGLGLAISKHIVEGTGGHITFETSEKGTTFYILLPKPRHKQGKEIL